MQDIVWKKARLLLGLSDQPTSSAQPSEMPHTPCRLDLKSGKHPAVNVVLLLT
jgi:hypothetical protein